MSDWKNIEQEVDMNHLNYICISGSVWYLAPPQEE